MATDLILGLDIGGTSTAVVLGDRSGRVHAREAFATQPERGFQATFEQLCATVDHVRAQTAPPPDVISVSVGGPLDITRGLVKSPPNLPHWDDIPLEQLLSERYGLPVYIEHDGNAGALAEWYFGAARGYRHVIFLTMGTGFGAGLILNSALYRGTNDLAGEVGHIRLADDGPTAFGKTGSWEAFCSGTGIARLAALRRPDRWPAGQATARDIVEAALRDDPEANRLVQEVGTWLGRGLALLVDILNPEIIVLGSLAVRLGDRVLEPARQVIAQEALPEAAQACRVVPAGLGERLGDVASLCAAIASRGESAPAP